MTGKSISTETQLLGLRSLFQQFGVLHELQITQLKYWPYAVDTSLESSEAEVDMDNCIIKFIWKAPKLPTVNAKYLVRLKELLKNVQFLLGEEWKIQILFNSETIFGTEDCVQRAPINTRKARKQPKRKPSNRRRSRNRS